MDIRGKRHPKLDPIMFEKKTTLKYGHFKIKTCSRCGRMLGQAKWGKDKNRSQHVVTVNLKCPFPCSFLFLPITIVELAMHAYRMALSFSEWSPTTMSKNDHSRPTFWKQVKHLRIHGIHQKPFNKYVWFKTCVAKLP